MKYLFVVILAVFFLYYLGTEISESHILSQTNLEAFIKKAGIFSWLAFLILIIVSVLGPLPSSLVVLVGGYIFNPFFALGLTLIGETIGATGNFYIGRKLGKKILMKKFPKVKKMIEKYGNHLTPLNIFLLGIIPVGTSNVTGYVAGMTKMSYKKYIQAWMMGIMLLNTAISFLGYSAKIQSLPLTAGIVIFAIIISAIMKRY